MEIELLTEFCRRVRGSTIKRLELVPEGYENWKISPGSLSFAEIAKHIIDLDYWLLEKIKNPDIKSIETETASIKPRNKKEFKPTGSCPSAKRPSGKRRTGRIGRTGSWLSSHIMLIIN
jgi:hypothetical protein